MRVSRRFRRILILGLLAAALLAEAALAQEKSLHWRVLDVRARLDADGRLSIAERQAMVFTGDWNGGERVFRLFPGQRLDFEKLTRADPATGEERLLSEGNLAEVDRYAWQDRKTLRWRSRLPSDPPFDRTEIVYRLGYTLSGVVLKEGDTYLLDHDFAFPERAGTIETFTLDLELDPVWEPPSGFSGRVARRGLLPGESVLVPLRLAYRGAGKPAAAAAGAPRAFRRAMPFLLLAVIGFLYVSFRRRERALGRFAPLPAASAIDEAWLKENLFPLKPEEAGALWDESVGAPEVAAVLARLTAEKKIETWASGKTLHMRLLVSREDLRGYEKELLEALFFGGRKETDTEAIRTHYKSKGFDPASKIRPDLEKRLEKLGGYSDRSPMPPRLATFLLVASGAALLVGPAFLGIAEVGLVIGLLLVHGFLYGVGLSQAYIFRRKLDHVDLHSLRFLFVPALFLFDAFGGVGVGVLEGRRAGFLLLAGLFLLRAGISNNLLNVAKTRNGPQKIARRKALAAARAFFEEQLESPSPRLSDKWMPYLVALGLGKDVDKWFRAYGGEPAAASGSSAGRTYSSSASPTLAGWTGGGGRSGGAGASASWAAAAGALAAGVSAPSSGSGGGGGGGGSSGGGGGGGW